MIPNEAVQAAMDVVLDDGLVLKRSLIHDLLEAAAPRLMAGAWDEAATVLYRGNAINQEHLQAMYASNPYSKHA